MDGRIRTFREFYDFYLAEHQDGTSRLLHFTGTMLVLCVLIYVLISGQIWWLIAIPLAGYSFAWTGHYFFEKNKPATFKYPLWSLASDFRLFYELISGKQKFKP